MFGKKKDSQDPNYAKSAWDLVHKCETEGKIDALTLATWQYNQEHLRNNPWVYRDKTSGKLYNLTAGTYIPDFQSTFQDDCSQYPTDCHIATIADGVKAKMLANPLDGQVLPEKSDDESRNSAKKSTLFLKYYKMELKEDELLNSVAGWIIPTGNAFIKDYWDVTKGPNAYVPDPITGEPTDQTNGKEGDVTSEIIPPQAMLRPKGLSFDKWPWIGQQCVMAVEKIKEKYGRDVPEEDGLEELTTLKATTYSASGNGSLKGHAKVIELYFPPDPIHPTPQQQKFGRHIIAANEVILVDDVFDAELTAQFGVWHPYSAYIPYKIIEGDDWAKTVIEYLTDDQNQLNKNYRQMMDRKQYTKGMVIYQDNTVDWDKVNLDPDDGLPKVPVTMGAQFMPQLVSSNLPEMDLMSIHQMIIQRMNDKAAQYEVSRGNADPSVTSGKQTQELQAANTTQHSPLLKNVAKGFIKHWVRILQLCSVHYTSYGRRLQVIGENNEELALDFKPEDIRSYNVVVAGGNNYFMDPEARRAELMRNFQMGLLGDPADPTVRIKFAELMEYGSVDEFYDSTTADIRMAKIENKMFEGEPENGIKPQLYETDPVFLKQFQQTYAMWEQQMAAWNQASLEFQESQTNPPIDPTTGSPMPVPDPGQPPEEPKPYRTARPYDNHAIHIDILNQLRKTDRFEKLCQQMPELREATDFHEQSHKAMMQTPPPMMPTKPALNPPPN